MGERSWLKELRERKNFTQTQISKMVGCSNKTISNIELGVRDPGGELAYKIARVLEFDVSLFYKHLDSA